MTQQSNDFGIRVRRDRLEANLSIRQLATAAAIDYSYVSKIETGAISARLSQDVVRRLADALHADEVEYFQLSGLLPDTLRNLIQFDSTREFFRVASRQSLDDEDWQALNQWLKRRIAVKNRREESAA